MTAFTAAAQEENKGVAILHTNDVHCGFSADDGTLGIAQLAAYKARLESENYQVILVDALEMGACFYPKENGSFMQVSGLTYEIKSYIPSSVTLDENGNFTGVTGE